MEEQAVKKRGWVKNAAIIFLSILLVLTFFSQTILNRSLPEVSTASVTSDSINAKIRGNGTVTAGDTYEVVLEETRTIQAVYAKVGDTVAVGDVLFLLADKDSTELSNAQDRLADAKRAYQSALIDMGGTDYARENRQIQKYREALAEAQAAAAAGAVTIEEVNQAAANLKEAQRVQKELNKTITETDKAVSEAESALAEYQSTAKSLENSAAQLEKTLEGYEDELARLRRGDRYDQQDLDEAQSALADARRDYANCWSQNQEALDSLRHKAEAIVGSSADEDEIILQMEALSDGWKNDALDDNHKATADERSAFLLLKSKYDDLKDAEAEVEAVQDGLNSSLSVQESIDKCRDNIAETEDQLDEVNAELREARKNEAYQQQVLDDARWQQEMLESNKEQQDEAVTAFQETYDDLKNKYDSYGLLQDAVEDAQDTLENALFDLAQQKEDDGKQAAKDQLSLQAQKDEIAKLEAEVAEWQAQSVGAEVTARSAGIISSVNAVAGREATPGSALATIEMVDRGYTLAFSVTKEQAQRVRLGDKAEITNYWWGSGIEATLTQIIPDENNPAANKKLVFTLTGDVSSGDNLTLSIGEKSANYDSVIPSSALRTDSNGTFVLVMTAKSTPLGNRYTATRVDVRVLAQDDTKTAVSGLSYGDFVITTSSKPLDAGMQVRMVDNAT